MLKATIVWCSLTVAIVGVQQAEHLLDLTTIPKPPAPTSGGGQGFGVSPESGGVLPLRLTLTKLDKTAYVLDEPIVYEVAILNLGDVPFVLPWTPWSIDHDLIRQSASTSAPFLLAHLSLEGFDHDHWRHFAVIGLEGTAAYSNSVQVLNPGETATIRVPMRTAMIPEDAAAVLASAVKGAVQIRAQLAMMVRDGVWAEPIDSDNVISIQLGRRGLHGP